MPILQDFLASRQQGIRPYTVAQYRKVLGKFLNNYSDDTKGVRQYLADLTCSTNSKRSYWIVLNVFYRWQVSEG